MAKPPPSTVDNVVSLAKRRGFVYPCGEIYGGTRSAWDYGPARRGAEGEHQAPVVEVDGHHARRHGRPGLPRSSCRARCGIASGHVETFTDPLTGASRATSGSAPTTCGRRWRRSKNIDNPDDVDLATVACPNCGTRGAWTEPRQFSGLLRPTSASSRTRRACTSLRPETAQASSSVQANVVTSSRQKPPFGTVDRQSFRNEITPGNFIFRTREFEQMEMEFFVKPGEDKEWHQYWDRRAHAAGGTDLGRSAGQPASLRAPAEKLNHYSTLAPSTSSTDSGSRAPGGAISRASPTAPTSTSTHGKHSGRDLSCFDQANNRRYVPYVIRPHRSLHAA